MTKPAGISGDSLARAVLDTVAKIHGNEAPLGSFARMVLSGEASLREAANNSWHGEALGQAFADAVRTQAALSPEARAEIEQAARKLAAATDAAGADSDAKLHPHLDPSQDGDQ
jgi:hypothetical protein